MAAAARFAGFLKSAREERGLTQALLAMKCGLTGSYISLLESGKKPAPSDRVVRRLASVLGIRYEEALSVAHMDRAPEEIRRTIDRLRRQAVRERQLRERTAEDLFPLSLWNLVPGALTRRARAAIGPNPDVDLIEALDRLVYLARSSVDLPAFHRETRRVLQSLPAEKRRRIVESAPTLARAAADSPGPRLVVAPEPALPPDVLPGDGVAVDASLAPAAGDIVLVEEQGRLALRRFAAGTTGVKGVVVEVRRRLR